jgi:hypothetical protein
LASCPLHHCKTFRVEQLLNFLKEFLTSANHEGLTSSTLDKQSAWRQKLCLPPMNESLRTCRDLLQLLRPRRLLCLPQLHQCVWRRLNCENRVPRPQGQRCKLPRIG